MWQHCHSLTDAFSAELATATASLLWRKSLEFRDEKTFTIYVYALFSYSLALILLYGGHCFSAIKTGHTTSCIMVMSGFPHHVLMHPNT